MTDSDMAAYEAFDAARQKQYLEAAKPQGESSMVLKEQPQKRAVEPKQPLHAKLEPGREDVAAVARGSATGVGSVLSDAPLLLPSSHPSRSGAPAGRPIKSIVIGPTETRIRLAPQPQPLLHSAPVALLPGATGVNHDGSASEGRLFSLQAAGDAVAPSINATLATASTDCGFDSGAQTPRSESSSDSEQGEAPGQNPAPTDGGTGAASTALVARRARSAAAGAGRGHEGERRKRIRMSAGEARATRSRSAVAAGRRRSGDASAVVSAGSASGRGRPGEGRGKDGSSSPSRRRADYAVMAREYGSQAPFRALALRPRRGARKGHGAADDDDDELGLFGESGDYARQASGSDVGPGAIVAAPTAGTSTGDVAVEPLCVLCRGSSSCGGRITRCFLPCEHACVCDACLVSNKMGSLSQTAAGIAAAAAASAAAEAARKRREARADVGIPLPVPPAALRRTATSGSAAPSLALITTGAAPAAKGSVAAAASAAAIKAGAAGHEMEAKDEAEDEWCWDICPLCLQQVWVVAPVGTPFPAPVERILDLGRAMSGSGAADAGADAVTGDFRRLFAMSGRHLRGWVAKRQQARAAKAAAASTAAAGGAGRLVVGALMSALAADPDAMPPPTRCPLATALGEHDTGSLFVSDGSDDEH